VGEGGKGGLKHLESQGRFAVPFVRAESAPLLIWRLGREFNDLGKETMDDGTDGE